MMEIYARLSTTLPAVPPCASTLAPTVSFSKLTHRLVRPSAGGWPTLMKIPTWLKKKIVQAQK